MTRKTHPSGLTFVEVVIAIAVLAVIAVGGMMYQYLAVRHIRHARAMLAAKRVGQLALEDWKSYGGSPFYDMTSLNLGFVQPAQADVDYHITVDDLSLKVLLTSSDIATDTDSGLILRRINAAVFWRSDFSAGPVSMSDPSVTLSTYVRSDGGSGG